MKPVFAKNLMLADHIRADAGIADAVGEQRISAVYTAAYHVMKSGNKTQWSLVTEAVAQYADIKNVKAALDTPRITPAVRRMHNVYLAYGAALAACPVPSLMKGAEHEAIDEAAAIYAIDFVAIVTGSLDLTSRPKTDDEKAQEKAERAAKKAEGEAAAKAIYDAQVKAEASRLAEASAELAQSNVPTLADMVRTVANAIKQGMLDADALALIDGALDAVAVTTTMVTVDVAPEPAHA